MKRFNDSSRSGYSSLKASLSSPKNAPQELSNGRLRSMLLWVESSAQSSQWMTTPVASRYEAVSSELRTIDAEGCYNALLGLSVKDMVEFALLNEFGQQFSQKPLFHSITNAVVKKLKALL